MSYTNLSIEIVDKPLFKNGFRPYGFTEWERKQDLPSVNVVVVVPCYHVPEEAVYSCLIHDISRVLTLQTETWKHLAVH